MKIKLNDVHWTKVVALSCSLAVVLGTHAAFAKGGGGHGGGGHSGGHGGGGHSMSSRSQGSRSLSSGISSSRSLGSRSLAGNKLSSNLGGSQFKKSLSAGQSSLGGKSLRSGIAKSGNNSSIRSLSSAGQNNLKTKNLGKNLGKNTAIAGNLKSNKNTGISNKIGKLGDQGGKSGRNHIAGHDKSFKHLGNHKDHLKHDKGFCHKNPHCKPCPTNHCCPHFCPGTNWWFPVGCWSYGRTYVNVVDSADVVNVEQVANVPVASPVNVDIPLDVQLKNIELLDAGNPQAGLGPVYRITILNASDVAIEQGFEVGLVVSNGEDPGEQSPFASERVEGIGPGELLFVEVQLPEVVNRMAQTPSGQIVPFSTLFVAVDAREEISETEEGNNSAKVARTAIPVAADVSMASEF